MATRLIRWDRVKLDLSGKRRGSDGVLIIPGTFARTGLQEYDQGDGTIRVEYRSPDEVAKSAKSFEGSAITDLHPETEMVNPDNWRDLARGHIQDVVFDEKSGWLSGDFYVAAGDLQDKLDSGERSELSAGYFAGWDETPGELDGVPYHGSQRDIEGNHIATLPVGTARAGREARLRIDSKGNQIFPGADRGDREDGMETEITIDGITYKVTCDQAAAAAIKRAVAQGIETSTAVERERARADSAESEVKTLKAKVSDLEDPARVNDAVEARADLMASALTLGGRKLDLSGTDREIKIRALGKIGHSLTDADPDAYVDAMFDIEVKKATENKGKSVKDAVTKGKRTADQKDLGSDAWERMIDDALDRRDGIEREVS